ncbi:MAG: hypothetical protein ABJP45_06120 [Cyclobacteriaceae bacterium]
MKILNNMILTFFLATLLNSCSPQAAVSLDEADRLYFQMKPDESYEMYEKVWQDTTLSRKDRAEAAGRLATMSWLLFNKSEDSYRILAELEKLKFEPSKCYATWSRILSEEGDHDKAVDLARRAIPLAESSSQTYASQMCLATAVLEKYKSISFEGSWKPEHSKEGDLIEAAKIMQSIMTESPGDIAASKVHLGLSILTRNGPQAYAGWLSFYRADEEGDVHKTLKEAQVKLIAGLTSGPNLSEEQADQIISGLAESGFIEYAAMATNVLRGRFELEGDPIKDLMNYHAFLLEVERATVEFYRSEVADNSSEKSYKSAVRKAGSALWDQLSWTGKKPKFKDEVVQKELRKRFGMVLEFMNANGHFGVSLGHVVLDENRQVTQYGKTGNLRYIAIDHMVSNGYSSWFWDGAAQIGGWAPDESSILQVRSAYSNGPVRSWMAVTDSVKVEEIKAKIKENIASDDEIARKDPYAYLPGLDARITYNSNMRILSELKKSGFSGRELRTAFINTSEKYDLNASIFAHEGRHAIDKKHFGKQRSEDLEFTAKLSEIYFADHPFFSATAVLSQNIGDGTSHGQANQRVLKGIVGWMDQHKSEIQGFDSSRPTLPQLDKLSDDQLRSAVNSIDPMAG